MPRTRLAAVAAMLLVTLPTLLVATPAALAEDVVPQAGVRYHVLTGFTHRLYVAFPSAVDDSSEQPDCTSGSLGFAPASPLTSTGARRSACPYPIDNGQTSVGGQPSLSTKVFATGSLARSFNVSGNESLVYVHKIRSNGVIPVGATFTVNVYSGQRPVGTGTKAWTDADLDDNDGLYDIPIRFNDLASRVTFDQEQPVRLEIRASTPDPTTTADPTDPQAGTPTYTIDDTGSYLEVKSLDAVRAAAWVGDPSSPLPRTVFRPLPNETPVETAPRMQLFFSIQSAFGISDALSGPRAPQFSLVKDGQPQFLTPEGFTTRAAVENVTLRVPRAGIVTWTLPGSNPLDYRGFATGEYALQVAYQHRQGATISPGNTARFFITSQAVTLSPYKEGSLTLETPGHDVLPGGATNYLLLVNNSGSANDTFRIDAGFVAGTPSTGWSAEVRPRTLEVPAGQARLVNVTVTAPFAAAGASSVFRVVATSALDPNVVSPALTLSTTIATTLRREVGIIFPEGSPVLEPGQATDLPVYVWNRGTRLGNFSLDLIESPVAGWTVDLLNVNLPVQRLVLSNVPPGGIAEATLRATGPVSQAGATYPITLNATLLDAPGVAFERGMRLALRSTGGVALEVFESIGSFDHAVELTGTYNVRGQPIPTGDPACQNDASRGYACYADGASGAWFRVWVTNTGKVTETFSLGLETLDFARQRGGCQTSSFAPGDFAPGGDSFRFFARTQSGRPIPVTSIENLPPGRTAEVYVWRAIEPAANRCADDDTGTDFFRFLVLASGLTTGSVGTASPVATAVNTGGDQVARTQRQASIDQRPILPGAVYMEAVGRSPMNTQRPDEGPFFVDVANASRRSIESHVPVNGTAVYRVRVTNAAGWGVYEDNADRRVEPRVTVRADGVAKEEGWNVSIRRVLDAVDSPLPYGNASVNFTNARDGRVEAWIDYELEVVVKAPSAANGTALAGHRDTFFLIAELEGRGDKSTLEVTTVIGVGAEIQLTADTTNLAVHAGEPSPALLTVKNVGGSEANATLRAFIDPSTPNAAGWRVDPAFQNFRVAALKNRTIALVVTPPAGTGAGTTARVQVAVDYTPTSTGNATLSLPLTVHAASTLSVTAPQTDATIAPGGYANFSLNLRNTGNLPLPFRLSASPLPEWETTIGQPEGTLGAGEARTISYVLRAPPNVENNARYASVVRAVEIGNDANFDAQALAVNILGGKAAPFVSAPLLQKRVDRAGVQHFGIEVRNTGNAAGRLPLEVRSSDPSWSVGVQDLSGANVSSVLLAPNQLAVLNVTVRPPLAVPERTAVSIDVTAFSEDHGQASKVTLRAEIHDYGLQVNLQPARLDAPPGVTSEFTIRLRNTGNDNDTLNVSAHLPDLPLWTVTLSAERVLLEAGQEAEVRASVRSPTSPLPTPRAYSLKFFAGTVGGAAVGLPKNESVSAVVTILPYRSLDVDDDDQLELAVEADGRAANGFESFREISGDGLQTTLVAHAPLDGKARFFLDVPAATGGHDGIADVWFDPETVFAYSILHAPDVNEDGTPDYLVDVDNDRRIDYAYDTVGDTYWRVTEVNALGDARVQYLVDTSLDGRPDVYYDPEADRITKTQTVRGQPNSVVGIDTDGDKEVDRYYDTKTNAMSDASVAKAQGFFTKYWYFFALFAVMALVTIFLLVARRRRAD